MIRVTKTILRKIYKPRSKDAKKYDFGLLIVIGGSKFYSGSPALTALAGFRTGVDMVHVLAPKRAADIIASFSPNLAAYPLEGDWLEKRHLPILLTFAKSAEEVTEGKVAIAIGGGLGRSKETQEAILEFLSRISLPVVVDADAIHAVAKKPEIVQGKNFLFTPHSYEFFILTGKEVRGKTEEEKIEIVQAEAERMGITILLKGKADIISNGKEVALSKTGNPYLTKGGTGDTLVGICGALMARGVNPFLAGQAGVYINGRAGEIATREKREGLLATDLIEAIPQVIKF